MKNEKQRSQPKSPRLSETSWAARGTKQGQAYPDRFKDQSESEVLAPKVENSQIHQPLRVIKEPFEKGSSSRIKPSRNTPTYSNAHRISKQVNGADTPTYTRDSSTDTSSSTRGNLSYRTVKENKRTASLRARSNAYSTSYSSRPNVVVEVGRRQRQPPDHLKSVSRTLLDKFRRPLPDLKSDRTKGNTLKKSKQNREAHLLAELKKDTSIARSRASTVEEVFGSHGLSKHYDDTGSIDQKKSLTQPKAKKVKRSKVKLDWGVPLPGSTFNPADVIPPAEQARRLLDAKFEDISSKAPLTFLNERNDRQIDGKFQFIDSYIDRGGVLKIKSAPPDFGCTCFKQCESPDALCRCLQAQDDPTLVPYIRRQDGLTTLNPYFIDVVGSNPQEIYECNDTCTCSKECFNRVVQNGRTVPLQIFMTRRCGFGIRSPQPIKKGQFIDAYLGELLTTKQIEDYENASTEESPSYVFSLDFFGPASYHVQGLHFGSPTRFINHSCNPNARTFTVMMNHADQKVYKLAYFAIRNIPAMKEITFDYSPESAGGERWVPGPGDEDDSVVRCHCGEKNCRGRIWPKRQMARRKGRGWARA